MAVRPSGRKDPLFTNDDALASLLHRLATGTVPTRLVLLGDSLDLVFASAWADGDERAAERDLAAIRAVTEAHPRVFEALGAVAAAGHAIEVVPGNHDLALLRPDAQSCFRASVAAAAALGDDALRVVFHPWIFHVPGVVYAEHGHQHHDINYVERLLSRTATATWSSWQLSPAACLDGWAAEMTRLLGISGAPGPLDAGRLAVSAIRGRAPGRSMVVRRTAVAIARLGWHGVRPIGARARRGRTSAEHLRRHARATGLPMEAVVRIDRLAAPTPVTIAKRLLAGRRAASTRDAAPYMLAAARTVDAELSRAGDSLPFYVFGHTHQAADVRMGGPSTSARYLNPGTWSTMTRGSRDGAAGELSFVEILHGAGRAPAARLRRWDPAAGEAR